MLNNITKLVLYLLITCSCSGICYCSANLYSKILSDFFSYSDNSKVEKIDCRIISSNTIELKRYFFLKNQSYLISPSVFLDKENYLLHERNSSKKIKIRKVGFKRNMYYVPIPMENKNIIVCEKIFIQTKPVFNKHISFVVDVKKQIFGEKLHFVLDFEKQFFSPIIHVNQIGFRPEDVKTVYFGINMGNLGDLNISSSFEIIDAVTNKKICNIKSTQIQPYKGWRRNVKNRPYDHVLAGHFDSLKENGTYVIKHSTGYSFPFRISKDIYRSVLNTLAEGMYNQRREDDISPEYSIYARKGIKNKDIYVYDTKNLSVFLKGLLNGHPIKYRSKLEGKKVAQIHGGHMDAGDYGVYVGNSSFLIYNLISTIDLFGRSVFHDNLGLPESGDRVPDLLQELVIELTCLKDMQDKTDGGVFSMIKPAERNYEVGLPGSEPGISYYLAPKDTTCTAAYAAALARVARSNIFNEFYPGQKEELTIKAEKAWDWLEKNSGFQGYHHYLRQNGDSDDRVWAAVELYALTGKIKYKNYFEKYHKPFLRDNGIDMMNGAYGYATRSVVMWGANKVPFALNKDIVQKCDKAFRRNLAYCIKRAEETPYDLIFDDAYKRNYRIGWFFPVSAYSLDLLFGHKLYNNKKYLNTALYQIYYTLGANPQNKVFLTGLGYNSIKGLVDQKSLYDDIPKPVTGIPISPVFTDILNFNDYKIDLNKVFYPKIKPDFDSNKDEELLGIFEIQYDGWNTFGEMTIEKLGAMLCCFSILTPVSNTKDRPLELDISIKKTPDSTCILSIIPKDKNSTKEILNINWYLNGELCGITPQVEIKNNRFDTASLVSVEVVTIDGLRTYKKIYINTVDADNSSLPEYPAVQNQNNVVFSFDNTLSSQDDSIRLCKNGDVEFSNVNLGWLKGNRIGCALKFNGMNSYIYSDLPSIFSKKKSPSAVIVEFVIFVNSFPKENYLSFNFFRFYKNWNNRFEILRYKWSNLCTIGLGNKNFEEINFMNLFTLKKWHKIKFVQRIDKEQFFLDNKLLYENHHSNGVVGLCGDNIKFEAGNFNGFIDNMRIGIE